eukprot:2356005-Prymnesium_polylepis.1
MALLDLADELLGSVIHAVASGTPVSAGHALVALGRTSRRCYVLMKASEDVLWNIALMKRFPRAEQILRLAYGNDRVAPRKLYGRQMRAECTDLGKQRQYQPGIHEFTFTFEITFDGDLQGSWTGRFASLNALYGEAYGHGIVPRVWEHEPGWFASVHSDSAAWERCSCTVFVTHKLRVAKLYEGIVVDVEDDEPDSSILHFDNQELPCLLKTETGLRDGELLECLKAERYTSARMERQASTLRL